MKADASAQLRLLDLQAIDARVDQLRHQRSHLPELAEIATLAASRGEVEGQRIDHQIVVDDLTVAQAKADADVEQVKARRSRDRERIDMGMVTSPKDLEHLQHELTSLERRISVLEDEELEVMEQLESAQAAVAELEQKLAAHDERIAELSSVRDQRFAEIDRELESAIADRAPAVADIPEALLALYERLRASKGGVGAAELRARQCGGCRLTLDNAELASIRGRAADDVVRCEECTRILVRTAESGL
ncbi:zinc ribbon domain-containing protein [Nocardioides sp. R-C-SC26]|uniref:zinc ribbon domain-containing protein n=1 Tax=Nocardioides sp. R-C-SC26 TaxID=2870414 RepID=UPI001E321B7B|nr:C4-type zinc ribbon domain-containing protein [Nocardioides sp. R-C-SC26]